MDEIIALLILAITISVCWDYYWHDRRQDKWEKAHPNQTYISNYRKLTGK